jgi:hypothetical protein
MWKRLPLILALLCVCGVTFAAQKSQAPPKWSFVEAGYMDFDPDSGLSEDGWYAGGSMGLFKMLHLFAEYDDVGGYTFWNAGAGWHGLLGEPGDLYAQVQWNDVDVDLGNVSTKDDGYEVGAGVRWKFTSWFEAKAEVDWFNYDKAGDDFSYQAGVMLSILGDKLGFGANYDYTDDSGTLRGFARWNFGR